MCAGIARVMYPVPSHDQSCPVQFVYFFRSNKACDEAIGNVLGSRVWYLILPDEDDCVCAGVATWHALGKASNFIPIGMGPLGYVLGLAMRCLYSSSSLPSPMTEFAISQNHVIGRCRIDICWGITMNFSLGLVGFEM